MVLSILEFILVFALIILSIDSYFDIKSREIPDFLSYLLVFVGITFDIIMVIYENSLYYLYYLPVSIALLFGFSYLMYS